MDAYSVYYRTAPFWSRSLELTLYVVSAGVLIGHVFFIRGQMEVINVSLILVGTVFGFMTTFGLAPISNFAYNSKTKISPQILSIVRDDQKQIPIQSDSKRAA